MPSNKDLKKQATELAVELGKDVDSLDLGNKNNVDLNELVKSLRSEKNTPASPPPPPAATETAPPAPPAATETAATETAPTDAEIELNKEKEAEAAKKTAEAKKAREDAFDKLPDYRVADNKSTTSKRGIIGPGDEVKAEFFAGGQDTLDDLVDKGYVIKK